MSGEWEYRFDPDQPYLKFEAGTEDGFEMTYDPTPCEFTESKTEPGVTRGWIVLTEDGKETRRYACQVLVDDDGYFSFVSDPERDV